MEFQRGLGWDRPYRAVAPMVDQSELPFRLLCRRHNATLAYTPMMHAEKIIHPTEGQDYLNTHFTTCPEDHPLVAQLCGRDPEVLLAAGRKLQGQCEAIDINLGCPQTVARVGGFGAFLMDDWPRVRAILETLRHGLDIPVLCKIRIYPSWKKTVEYVQMLEGAGASLIAVHARTKEMKSNRKKNGQLRPADWEAIRKIKAHTTVPIIANGNIGCFQDIELCIAATGADGVMSAGDLSIIIPLLTACRDPAGQPCTL